MAQNLPPPCINYNTFFHPNLCHICKLDDQEMLNPCPQCLMISYCSEEHRLLHREEHKEMCEALQSISDRRNIRDSHNMDLETWIEFKTDNMSCMKDILHRKLQLYELEMIGFPKSCFICHQQHNLTENCPNCKSVNVCSDHEFSYSVHSCKELKLCLDINKYLANKHSEDITVPKNILHLEAETVSMKSFNDLHFDSTHKDPCWPFGSYIYSKYLTQPLTLYFGVKYTGLLYSWRSHPPSHRPFVVHIINGFLKNTNSLLAWEIILHIFRRVTSLIIIVIHPELSEFVIDMSLCEKCERDKKSLQYRYISNSYGDYANSSTYVRPNVIVGYHIDFWDDEVFNSKSIERVCCPLILTYYSFDTMRDNMSIISLVPIHFQTNHFACCAPLRCVEDGTVSYDNKYLIIYQNRYSYPEDEACTSSAI